MRKLLTFLGWYAALALAAALGWLLSGVPRPETPAGWVASLLLALPALLLAEALAEALLSRTPGAHGVERRARGRRFSWPRIAYPVVALLLAIVVSWMASTGRLLSGL